jgi:hypothetical protein
LKPDVCRRVVGRLPSPHVRNSLQKLLRLQQRGMAPPLSFLFLDRDPQEKDRGGLSCEIARTYARTDFSRLARST